MTADKAWTPHTLAEVITSVAERCPGDIAVVCDDREIAYERLHRGSSRTAHALLAQGLAEGARVAYLGRDSEFYFEVLFACAKSGTVLVPVNWRLTGAEIAYQLENSGAKLVFADSEHARVARTACEAVPQPPTVVEINGSDFRDAGLRRFKEGMPDDDLTPRSSDDPVVQLYTSGTTGTPKGVVLPHRSFLAVREALLGKDLDWLDWHPDDKALIGVPGFHVGGIWLAVQTFIAGAALVVMRTFTPGDLVSLIRAHQVTVLCMVPAMIQVLLAMPDSNPADVRSVRKVVYGGSPISPTLLEQAMEFFHCDFSQIYGLTETGNTALCLPPGDHTPGNPRLQSAGIPYPGFEVKVVDREGEFLGPGHVGEICISTPAAMIGYWHMPDATAEVLRDGWVHTGDAGFLDDDGYLFIRDRIKDVIIVAGENIYPAEVEAALSRHPSVAEVAVIGIPDSRWGERVHACVVVAPGRNLTSLDLRRALVGEIADFKIPTSYEFLQRLPRTASGKVQRRRLREPHWNDQDRHVN